MAILIVLVIAALYGLLNGILVALADIDSFGQHLAQAQCFMP